jgi:hypothetical protein
VTAAGAAYEPYRAAQSQEWMMRIGDPRTPPILFAPPLFEELNRTRALIVAIMRLLAEKGHGCWLPDLGGTGESLAPLETARWEDWRHDVAAAGAHVLAASGKPPVIAAVRGGALLDDAAAGRGWWRFAPVEGLRLARDLDRAALAGGAEWAGYPAPPALREALRSAVPQPVTPMRTVRLASDAAAADLKVEGPALWRRSEPGMSHDLAVALATDLDDWSRVCAAS